METTETKSSYGLEEVHSSLLAQIKDIDRICRKHNIEYSLHAGTLLGAVRNHRFIPWDDDIDVTMTRENYKKFAKIIPEESMENVLDINNTWLPRIVSKDSDPANTTFIDIFIYDSISSNKLAQKLKFICTRFLQGTVKERVNYSDFRFKERILLWVTHIIGKPFSKKQKLKVIHFLCEKMFGGDGQLIHRSNDAYKAISIILEKKDMEHYIDFNFENTSLMVTSEYEKVLITSYGRDYMTPPPEAERVPLHDAQRSNFNR